ncbi:Contains similarity to RNA binding protein PufA from Dictyostelium discoideum gi/5106561 and contains multiple Pumilio-family RNA binding PF/00806 domains [Arabidopsis thaliana]|nr:Contains similarity to RNA binding protein PufA from Dictyostelium discoideum gi/5106561 and contains multiple Pumilio-family RNA binding PF/00806 domains [Arabidopsis thaliana]
MRGEFGEASSLSRSPSSPLQTEPHPQSPKFYRNHYVFSGDHSSYNSSSRFCLRSPSDYSLSSYFSNGLCSSEDGSSQFASPPLDGLMTKYNFGGDDLGLCESFDLLNVGEEDKTHHQTQRSSFGNYEANGDGGFRYYSGFGVDQKDHQISNSWNLGMQSCNMNNYSVPVHGKSGVGALFDHQGISSNPNESLPKVSEFQGYVYFMAKDQHGCRFLQWIFEDGSALDALVIFSEVIPHVVELMMDPFGNYLMQKLLDVCNEEQRTQIILMVTSEPGQLIRISLNAYGTRVVQRLVESIKTRKQISLVKSALRPGFLNLIRDLNGNHVIQRCLQCLSTEDNEFIFEDATKFCIDIATHRHGCCVLQKCIAYSSGLQREKLVTEISRNSLFLAQDPYGNYAVQFVLELRDFSAIAAMLAQLKGHYVELSMQKFSSHMVERCLTHCPESRPQIVRELISVPHFDILIQDPYANFVIQAALAVTKGSLHATLVEVIRPHSILRNNPYCKRIFSRNLLKN